MSGELRYPAPPFDRQLGPALAALGLPSSLDVAGLVRMNATFIVAGPGGSNP